MSKFRVVGTIAFVLCLGAANASATAQGRSEGAPGWGGGGQPGTQFETPKGPDELTKPHTTGPPEWVKPTSVGSAWRPGHAL
jgi:hypothetical protein